MSIHLLPSSTLLHHGQKSLELIACVTALCLLLVTLIQPATAAQPVELTLFEGETRVLPEPNAGRLAVGNGKVLSAAVLDEGEILLIANAVGSSSLHIWRQSGPSRQLRITVLPAETPRIEREITAFLAAIPKARSSVIGDRIVIEGEGLSNRDHARIAALAEHYPQVLNFTSAIGWEKMIVMEVHIVEFPAQLLRETGLDWQARGGGLIAGLWSPLRRGALPLQLDFGSGQGAPVTNNVDSHTAAGLNVGSTFNVGLGAELRLLEQQGQASILARPVLSARNGAEASFLAGGEFPYTVSNLNGTTVQFKPYGIRLEIHPTVDDHGIIRARILSEVSDLDPTVTSAAGPALRTRKTETEFNVSDGGTIVLSGLLTRDISHNESKLPLLGDLPVLGPLFRSQRYQNQETELVVFVTPQAVDQHSIAQAASMSRALDQLKHQPRAQAAASSKPSTPAAKPQSGDDILQLWMVN